MASHFEDRLLLKPLTQLSFISRKDSKTFRCQSGRLKWRGDTKALSIKAAITLPDSEGLAATSEAIILVASAKHDSTRFILSNGFSVALQSCTAGPGEPSRLHYCIQAMAEPTADERKPV